MLQDKAGFHIYLDFIDFAGKMRTQISPFNLIGSSQ